MASPRDPGRFPVFATCPVVISAHSQTIVNQGEKKAGHYEFHSSRQTSSTASSPWPFKIHSRPLQPRPEWGGMLEPGGAGPRPERSIRPRLFPGPADRHQASDDGRSLARVGYEAGDLLSHRGALGLAPGSGRVS